MRGEEGEGMGTVSIQCLNELFTRIELFNYIQMSTQQGAGSTKTLSVQELHGYQIF